MIVSKNYKCPGCGGSLIFDTSHQTMFCEYCNSHWSPVTFKKVKAKDPVILDFSDKDNDISNVQAFVCSSCGGVVYADENTVASFCPYCNGAVIFDESFKDDLKPDFVVPFQVDRETALKTFKQFLKETKFLPKEAFKLNAEQHIKAIYMPFWFSDFNIKAKATFKATDKEYYGLTDHETVKTVKYSILRKGEIDVCNLPANGSVSLNSEIMEAIEPYSLLQSRRFDPVYLSGFLAEKYTVGPDQIKTRTSQRAKREVLNRLGNSIVLYDKIEYDEGTFDIKDRHVHYGLCPVYLISIPIDGKDFTFALNGQTGKYATDIPINKKKIITHKALPIFGSLLLTCFVMSFFLEGDFKTVFLSLLSTPVFAAVISYFQALYTLNKKKDKVKIKTYISSADIDNSEEPVIIKSTNKTRKKWFVTTFIRKRKNKLKKLRKEKLLKSDNTLDAALNYSERTYLSKTDKQLKLD